MIPLRVVNRKPPFLFYFILGMIYCLCFAPIFASSNEDEICMTYEDENEDGCFCAKRPSPLGGYGRRVTCHALKDMNTFPKNLPSTTIQLDLSKNGLTGRLNAESLSKIPYLHKLDLQGNDISSIENNAFVLTPHLEVLDLSRNKLQSIQRHTFTGLKNLKKLRLNDNQIQTLVEGSFDSLISLEKLELSDNTLVCNCSLAWFVKWIEDRPSLLANPSKLKCALPIKLADKHIRKIVPEDMRCDQIEGGGGGSVNNRDHGERRNGLHGRSNNAVNNQFGMLEILPSHHQVAFGGDNLKLSCKAELHNSHKVSSCINQPFASFI